MSMTSPPATSMTDAQRRVGGLAHQDLALGEHLAGFEHHAGPAFHHPGADRDAGDLLARGGGGQRVVGHGGGLAGPRVGQPQPQVLLPPLPAEVDERLGLEPAAGPPPRRR